MTRSQSDNWLNNGAHTVAVLHICTYKILRITRRCKFLQFLTNVLSISYSATPIRSWLVTDYPVWTVICASSVFAERFLCEQAVSSVVFRIFLSCRCDCVCALVSQKQCRTSLVGQFLNNRMSKNCQKIFFFRNIFVQNAKSMPIYKKP